EALPRRARGRQPRLAAARGPLAAHPARRARPRHARRRPPEVEGPQAVSADLKLDMPVVILAGGLGTRLREETEYRPKPMVKVGHQPILWHIMKLYSHHGFRNFIVCLGYKGEM